MEGYGGPIQVDKTDFSNIDPTLDSCCRREQESQQKYNVTKAAIMRHDRISQTERRRRHVLTHPVTDFTGCRCCYDVSLDGGGDYMALFDLRREREKKKRGEDNKDDEENNKDEEKVVANKESDDEEEDSDDDSEFDYLLDEDLPTSNNNNNNTATSNFEQRRREELEQIAFHQETSLNHGYGKHVHIHPTRLLRAADLKIVASSRKKKPAAPAIVVHLYDENSVGSASLDLYLETIGKSGEWKGTKFMYCHGRGFLKVLEQESSSSCGGGGSSGVVVPKLQVQDLPALLLIKHGTVVTHVPKLQSFINNNHHQEEEEEVNERAVESFLENAGVLIPYMPPMENICSIRVEEDALLDNMRMLNMRAEISGGGGGGSSSNNNRREEEELYECGVKGCQKSFYHEHVGIKTEESNGLVVKEDHVIS